MRKRKDIEYEITPKILGVGERWMTVKIKNAGKKGIRNLNVRLNSLDTLGIEARESSRFLAVLAPGQEVHFDFLVYAYLSAPVYVSMDGYKEENELYYWESPPEAIFVGEDSAEILSLFATRKPNIIIGDTIKCDAAIEAKKPVENLHLETWVEAPDGVIEELKTESLDRMNAGEIDTYSAEFVPELNGIYTVHSELFDGIRRLGHKTDYVLVKEA